MIGTSGRDSKRREDFRSNQNNSYGGPNKKFLNYAEEFYGKGKTAIDIASGNGRYAIELANMGYQTDALEYSQAGVDRIIRKACDQELDVNAYQGDFTLEYSNIGSYDLVLSSGLLEEIDKAHHRNVISGYQNATKEGGLCMIKRCIEISGRGRLVDEGWIQQEFETKEWEIVVCIEKKDMKNSNATMKFNKEFDANIRTGTLVAKKI